MIKGKIPSYDSFSLDEEIARNRLDKTIKTESLIPLSIPQDFTILEPKFTKKEYSSEIRTFIEPISRNVESLGFGPSVFTALYEGLLNAFQHGNYCNENKELLFAHFIEPKNIEFMICDQGKKLHPKFLRFILKHRERTEQTSNFINWYKHSGEDNSNTPNLGLGTSFMHAYMSEVKYFNSVELGGLALYLNKKN